LLRRQVEAAMGGVDAEAAFQHRRGTRG
jgi:hypothetical protein